MPKSRLLAGEVSRQSLFPLVGARVICPRCGMANRCSRGMCRAGSGGSYARSNMHGS